MKERSSTHQEASSTPSHVFRKTKTSEGSSATASGLNASFTHVPASGAIQRAAMEEGGGEGGGIMLSEGALSMLPDDVVSSLGSALGGEAGEMVRSKRSEFSGSAPAHPKSSRQVFSKDVENPRHVVDRNESDKTGFDREGTSELNGAGAEGAGAARLQSRVGEDSDEGFH